MKKTRKIKIKELINTIIIFIAFLLLIISQVIYKKFDTIYFEQILNSIFNGEGTGLEGISGIINTVILTTIVLTVGYVVVSNLIYKYTRKDLCLYINIRGKEKKINIFKNSMLSLFRVSFLVLFISLILSLNSIGFFKYLNDLRTVSTIFEEHYVNPAGVKVEFPKKKRNLILIYLESMEMTGASSLNGGQFGESLIPNLEQLAIENINFSNTDKLGGFRDGYGGNWTMGAIVSSTSGVPLKIVNMKRNNNYSITGESLPGVYTLGDMLKDNGYNNYFMMGSDASFGGRESYLRQHGDYEIYDYYKAIEDKVIKNGYFKWWGFEDKKLFSYAKDKLIEIAKDEQPFNFTLLTADTHFIDGYLDETCKDLPFDTQYENVMHCSDAMVYEFVKWIKNQEFYDNTTIVIIGDHETMQEDLYSMVSKENRVVYNTFINTAVDKPQYDKNRDFTNLDLYPTILASLGVKINGDRLGLGVNMFSNERTLAEIYGVDELYEMLSHRSEFYIDKLMGESYYDMLDDEVYDRNDMTTHGW